MKNQSGQILVILLVIVVVAIIITSASVVIVYNNTQAAGRFEQGTETYYVAESGLENALLRLLREPNYTGETLNVDNGTAVIQVTGTNPIIVTSQGTMGNYQRIIQVKAVYNNNILTINSWKEIY